MEPKSNDISMKDAVRIANSPAGQQLLQHLKSNNSVLLNQAMSDAASGDYAKVKESIAALLASPQVRQLMQQLQEDCHG